MLVVCWNESILLRSLSFVFCLQLGCLQILTSLCETTRMIHYAGWSYRLKLRPPLENYCKSCSLRILIALSKMYFYHFFFFFKGFYINKLQLTNILIRVWFSLLWETYTVHLGVLEQVAHLRGIIHRGCIIQLLVLHLPDITTRMTENLGYANTVLCQKWHYILCIWVSLTLNRGLRQM